MKTTFKHVSYFYPTSGNAKRFNLPNGGYDVALTTSDGKDAKTEWVAGFATEAEAMAHAETLPHEWASWQKLPASPEGVACVPATDSEDPIYCLCECGHVHPIGGDCPTYAPSIVPVEVPAVEYGGLYSEETVRALETANAAHLAKIQALTDTIREIEALAKEIKKSHAANIIAGKCADALALPSA